MRSRLSSEARAGSREMGRGLAVSALLHSLFAVLVYLLLLRAPQPTPALEHFLPVDLVPVVEHVPPARPAGTSAPPAARARPARFVPSSPRPPVALSRPRTKPPPDALEMRLKRLALLRQPDSILPYTDNGADAAPGESDGVASSGYRVRDFLRAQIERRWSLDLGRAREGAIRIHIVLARDGTVRRAEIVDPARYAADAAWRETALSARNAALLASPLRVPAGYPGPFDLVLALDPRDATR